MAEGDVAVAGSWWDRMVQHRRGLLYDLAVSLGFLAAAACAGLLLDYLGLRSCIVLVFVLAVQLVAFFTWHRLCCLVSSAAAVALVNYLFTEPRFTFHALDGQAAGTFAVMFVVSLLSSSIALALRHALRHAAVATHRSRMLLDTSHMLQQAGDEQGVMRAAGTQVAQLTGFPCVWYRAERPDGDMAPVCAYSPAGEVSTMQMLAPEMPPFLGGSAYVGTPLDATFGGALHYGIYLTVRSGELQPDESEPPVLGVLAVAAAPDRVSDDQLTIANAIISEAELTLDRVRALRDREQAAVLAQNEQLRANLLRSISHDLRTPLTSISGTADVLLDQGSTGTQTLDSQTRRKLLKSIRSDALWLNATVENLLAITKLEDGGMHLSPTLELMDDIIEEALRHVNPAIAEHEVEVLPAEEPALVNVDARLMVQLVVNLVNNAVTYTPEGSHICISLAVGAGTVTCSVADDGPGIAPEDRARIFDSFYTVNHGLADGHRSVGLGLSLCRSIAAAHGGIMRVEEAEPHGCVFSIDLPAADIPLDKEDSHE